MRTNSQGLSSLDALVPKSSQFFRYADCWCSSGLRCSFLNGFLALTVEHLSSSFSSYNIFGSRPHPVLTRIGRGHFRKIFFPVLSTLLLRIYKQGEYKREGAWVGAGVRATGGENGFLQVVTVQSSTDTDFRQRVVIDPFLMVYILTLFQWFCCVLHSQYNGSCFINEGISNIFIEFHSIEGMFIQNIFCLCERSLCIIDVYKIFMELHSK